MRIPKLFTIIFTLFLIGAKAQNNNSEWRPVLNNYDGTNMNEGVEATCLLTKCDGQDVVVLKLVNHNNRKLKATWVHLVETTGAQKISFDKLLSLVLEPNSDNTGNCAGTVAELKIRLSDFGVNADNFGYYIAKNFHLNVIEK